MTPLGEILADQMIAMINNKRINYFMQGQHDQELKGVLQEVDGYLHIHIRGFNGAVAQSRSCTARVEMPEALYLTPYVFSF